MRGYGGRILFVDLTRGTSRIDSLAEDTARALLGGNGLAARLLFDHVPAEGLELGPAWLERDPHRCALGRGISPIRHCLLSRSDKSFLNG